ncbi:MAG TPA: FemAB family XrtA/PEP-CTERM system-associated protein [Rhizomicrobium sp.]|jgi:FemAB-related protein (PEP-CTERM system-associated)
MRLDDSGAEAAKWDAYVHAHPDGTFFHLSGWRHVAADVLGHRPHYLTTREAGALTGLLPLIEVKSRLFGHSLISTAFCVGGGPLWSNGEAFSRLLREAEERARALGASYIELRDTETAAPEWTGRSDLYAGFAGPIAADEAENLKQIPRKQRAVVRKALTVGFTITIDNAIDPFFQLYARNMRDHGTPALPRRFFSTLLKAFGTDCEILTVHLDGRPISSVLSYFFRGRVLPYYTGSMPEARATGANDHMYWSLMRRAVERGCDVFDFGRSKVGTGPYNFKRNWGFEPRPITHQYRMLNGQALPNINPTNPRYALFIRAWQKLPLPIANLVSPILSRSLG